MTYVVLLGVVVVQGLVLEGWHRVLDAPGRLGGLAVGAGAALACDLLVLSADGDAPFASVPAVLAMGMVAAVVHQMLRRDGREDLTSSFAATVSVIALVAVTTGYLAALTVKSGLAVVATVGCAAGLSALVHVLGSRVGLPGWLGLVLGPALAAVAGAGAAVVGPLAVGDAVLLAVAAAAAATAGGASVARAPRPGRSTGVGLSFATAAPLAYVMGTVLVG